MNVINITRSDVNHWLRIFGFIIVAMSVVQLSLPETAHAKAVPFSLGKIDSHPSFAGLIEQVNPAVVNITVQKNSISNLNGWPPNDENVFPYEEFFKHYFDDVKPHQIPQGKGYGVGTGFIIDSDGYLVTNHHVIDDAVDITVTLHDGKKHVAEVVGIDAKTDLALIKIDQTNLPYVKFGNSDESRVGDWVVAIGNPFGFGGTATVGIISARGRDLLSGPYNDYLQIDAPINRGNSGGPVFNEDGEVVGVNAAIYSPNGGNIGIGFATPSNLVQEIVAELKEHGEVKRGWLGVQIQALTSEVADSLELENTDGALVASVISDSPADKAGIEVGDVIIQLDHHDIDSPKTLSKVVASLDWQKKAKVKVWRDEKHKTLHVKIGKQEQSKIAGNTENNADTNLGLTIAPLTDGARSKYGYDDEIDGVLITSVKPGSKAFEKGFRSGDVILQLNKSVVNNPEDVINEIKKLRDENSDTVLMLVRRNEEQRFIALSLA